MVKTTRKGQSSIELLVALAIFVLAISAMIALVFGGQSLMIDASRSNQALALARENLEKAAATARNNFPGLISTSVSEDGFTKELLVETQDANTKRVRSRVSWQASPLRSENVELTQIITNWKTVKDTSGDTGGTDTFGDWQNPQTLGSVDLGPGNSATDLDVYQKVIYLTAQASDPKKEDFFVVSAVTGQSPQVVAKIDTGKGLNAVDVAGNKAYTANDDTSGQLQIIDVSNPQGATTVVSSLTLPGVNGAGAVGQSIFYDGGMIYLGTKRASGPEFHVIDVSDPLNPVARGSFEINADVNMIQVSGHYAYVATSDDAGELKILNVQDPAAITAAGSFNASGTGDALSLYLYGSTLYLGRASGSPELYILDISAPANIATLGSASIGSDVTGIRIRDTLMFMGTSDSNKEFQVWNVTNPAAISLWSSFNFPQVATGIDYEDNLVYVSVRSNDAVRIITAGP